MPDLRSASITEKPTIKETYTRDLAAYELDSVSFYSIRKESIAKFCTRVDSIINHYRRHLSPTTDLITAIAVADRCFNFSRVDGSKNFLMLNSDGLDTHHQTISHLKNPGEVILINAGNVPYTSIDGIVTRAFESSEQAIQFTLH